MHIMYRINFLLVIHDRRTATESATECQISDQPSAGDLNGFLSMSSMNTIRKHWFTSDALRISAEQTETRIVIDSSLPFGQSFP